MNAIELSHVTKHFPGFTLQDLSLTVPSGTICGLVGENGAGKSTTIRLLMGALRPDSGTCTVLGADSASPEFLSLKEDIGVVLDEAYMDFWDQSMLGEVEAYDNLILLRTCSKALGMAALRVGFAVANPTLTGVIRAAKSPYNVNAVSQAMAAVVLENPAYHEIYRELLLASRDMLVTGLKALEADGLLRVFDSCTNFAYLQVPEARALFAGLADRGIIVRRFGEEHLRITAGTQAENQEVLAVLNFLLRHPDALAEYK